MDNEYCGFRTVASDNPALAALFQNDFAAFDSSFDKPPVINEYILIEPVDGTAVKDIYRKSENGSYSKVVPKSISSHFLGDKLKPRNSQQVCAVDMLYDRDITIKMLAGKFGSGKTFLMTAAGVDLVERGSFDKIVYVRNNIEVKNSKPIGFLPGTYNEKLLPFASPLADHLGGMDGLEIMIRNRKIEVMHLGFIRGRDIKNSIILCSEAENLTKEHVQLLISRVGENSELWLDGDVKQRDEEIFFRNSGMSVAIERLTGHRRFGYVKLLKTERSETAAMADLLD